MLEDGDLFFPLSKWPPIAKQNMLKIHKTNNERYYLMRFLCYNGLRPEVASNWILREGQYDQNAHKDQQVMIQKAKGQEFYAKGKIFNMRYGRTDSLHDPPPREEEWNPQPPSSPPRRTFTWDDLIAKFPMPVKGVYDTREEFLFQMALWKVESRRFFEEMHGLGYEYIP